MEQKHREATEKNKNKNLLEKLYKNGETNVFVVIKINEKA